MQPAELNYTLNALANALEGRGDKLGESLETLDGYLKRMNPQLPALIDDIKLLATVTDIYADVFPQLADTLRNTVKTGNTLVSREQKLKAFLNDLTSFSDTTKAFLDDNGDNIIRLGQLSEPILALLRRYSGTFPCLLEGIVGQAPMLARHLPWLHLPHQPQGSSRTSRAATRPLTGRSTAPTTRPNCAGPAQPADPVLPVPQPPGPQRRRQRQEPGQERRGSHPSSPSAAPALERAASPGPPQQKGADQLADRTRARHHRRPDVRRREPSSSSPAIADTEVSVR